MIILFLMTLPPNIKSYNFHCNSYVLFPFLDDPENYILHVTKAILKKMSFCAYYKPVVFILP